LKGVFLYVKVDGVIFIIFPFITVVFDDLV